MSPAGRTAAHLELGARGEAEAARAYEREGWRVVARNWRPSGAAGLRGLELDLVCVKAGALVVVEVKTRTATSGRSPLGEPGEWLSPAKARKLSRAVAAYLTETGQWALACRVDLAAVTMTDGRATLERCEDVLAVGVALNIAVRRDRAQCNRGGGPR